MRFCYAASVVEGNTGLVHVDHFFSTVSINDNKAVAAICKSHGQQMIFKTPNVLSKNKPLHETPLSIKYD